ncbi:hypothetical protein E2C01_045238 [Portunus trituberculatus]|uniref:Uncharacterized protein n=1 Tax=Portunus trituberculatus TaxID=210409 RepID=A0A5B7G4H7_PORTR|nr:hypothetical protein [Portunus trituberculatus]
MEKALPRSTMVKMAALETQGIYNRHWNTCLKQPYLPVSYLSPATREGRREEADGGRREGLRTPEER